MLIRGGRVIDPLARMDAVMDVLLRDGQVAEIAPPNKIRAGADEKIYAGGLIVAPGFIDLHCHLREPGQGYKETIASGTAAAMSRPMPTSSEPWPGKQNATRPLFMGSTPSAWSPR